MSIPNLDTSRRQATCLFHGLEMGLARILTRQLSSSNDFPEQMRASLQARARDKGAKPEDLAALIQQLYFAETLELLVASEPVASEQSRAASEILAFVKNNDLHEIRNAIAHPNRPWKLSYLPLIEALCLSQAVTIGLEMSEVADAYACIKLDTFATPDGDWLARIQPPTLPNNLDAHLRAGRHTTFVGRSDERMRLKKHLRSKRTNSVCVVGPGGIGKTAFVLRTMQELAEDRNMSSRLNRILFLTGKQRQLTLNGAISQTPDFKNLDELRLAIALELGTDSFDDCVEAFSDLRLLLCIDNLEELLGAHPTCLEEFQDNLPVPWVLLVTSRITVPAQFAIALQSLRIDDLEQIARERLQNSGLATEEVLRTARSLAAAAATPLALIIAADAIAVGGTSVAQAIERSARLTADFAFSSLLELQSEVALRILDTIYATTEQVDADTVGALLEHPRLGVEESIIALRQSNLLLPATEETEQPLRLSPPVRELLASGGVSQLSRDAIYKSWSRIQTQSRLVGDVLDHGLPMPETRNAARLQLVRLRERIHRSDQFLANEYRELEQEVVSFERQFGRCSNSAWLLADLADRATSMQHEVARQLVRAHDLSPNEWRIRCRLAQFKFAAKDYAACAELLYSLVTTLGSDADRLPSRIGSEVFSRYFQSRMFFECDRIAHGAPREVARFTAIIEELDKFSHAPLELSCRLFRASILRRSVERQANTLERFEALNQALRVFSDTFEERDSIVSWWCPEVTLLLEQFVYARRTSDAAPILPIALEPAEQFCARWGASLIKLHRRPYELAPILRELARGNVGTDPHIDGNSISLGNTENSGSDDPAACDELTRLGFVTTSVYAPPLGRNYCFSRDRAGITYYINRNVFDGTQNDFDCLDNGDWIWVLSGKGVASSQALPALSAVRA